MATSAQSPLPSVRLTAHPVLLPHLRRLHPELRRIGHGVLETSALRPTTRIYPLSAALHQDRRRNSNYSTSANFAVALGTVLVPSTSTCCRSGIPTRCGRPIGSRPGSSSPCSRREARRGLTFPNTSLTTSSRFAWAVLRPIRATCNLSHGMKRRANAELGDRRVDPFDPRTAGGNNKLV